MITLTTQRGSKIDLTLETAYGVQMVQISINGTPDLDTFTLQIVDGLGLCLRGTAIKANGVTTIPVPAERRSEIESLFAAAKTHNAERATKARNFDRSINEGGYGYNPYR